MIRHDGTVQAHQMPCSETWLLNKLQRTHDSQESCSLTYAAQKSLRLHLLGSHSQDMQTFLQRQHGYWSYSRHRERLGPLRGRGGLNLVDHGNWFNGVFWQKTMRSISGFLPHQKILILTKVIARRRLVLMRNSIACANFNRDFPKMAIFQTPIPYWAYSLHRIILNLGRH